MIPSTIFLGLLVAVSSVSGNGLWPKGKEFTYQYSANVQVGSVDPAQFTSEYTIHGNLRLQALEEDEIYVKLDDVKYQLYNGDYSYRDQSSQLPAPEEASPISSPFRIEYKDGKVKKLFTETSDPLWVVNIKKGLASLLQLDLLLRKDVKVLRHFWGEEDTIFGACNISYTAGFQEYNIITKTVNPETCRGYPYKTYTNQERHGCGLEPKERPNASLYKRTYHIPTRDPIAFSDVTSEYTYTVTPYRGNGDAYYVKVNQTASLLKSDFIQHQFALSEEQEVQKLTYTLPVADTALSAGLDLSMGRISTDSESLVSKAVSMLDEILQYQQEAHVHNESPNLKKSGLVFYYVNQILGRLSSEDLSIIYSQLGQGSSDWDAAKREVFVKLLPEVGTNAAVITVRNLIRKHKIKTYTARDLLQVLPFNVHNPNEKLLHELEDLIELNEEYPEEVRYAALLSFATLVNKAAKITPKADFVNKYAEIYFNGITENENDYASQVAYLQGLGNIQVGKAAEYLETIIREGDGFSRHLKHLALWNFAPNVYNDYKKAHSVYWPILVDNNLHLQHRSAALKIILEFASDMDHFLTIHSYMSTQRNNIHLYNIYYKTLVAKTSTTNPCYGKTAEYARQILRFTEAPLVDNWGSGVEVFDFTDKTYGFGRMIRLQTVAEKKTGFPSVLQGEYQEIVNGLVETPYSVYLKGEGIEQFLWGKLGDFNTKTDKAPKFDLLGVIHKTNQLNFEGIIRAVLAAQGKIQKPIHIELILTKQGRTIQTFFLDNARLKRMLEKDIPQKIKEFKNILQNLNSYIVRLETSSFSYLPTDLGVPLILHKGTPSIFSMSGGASSESSLQLDSTFRLWSNSINRLVVLNPVAGIWHGVEESISKDIQIPVRVALQRDEKGFKLVFGSPKGLGEVNATIGSQWYKQSHTFVCVESDNRDPLGASCPNCRRVAPITRGYNNLKEVVILHTKLPGTGLVADVRAFNCERDISITSLKNLFATFFDNTQHNTHDNSVMHVLLGVSHLVMYNDLNPGRGQCGFLTRLIPDPEINGPSQIEISMKVNGGEIPGGNIVLQGFKLNVVVECILRGVNGEAIQKNDIRAEISSNAGYQDNSLAIQIANYKYNKPNAKWCLTLTKKYPQRGMDPLAFGWGNEQVDSKVVISVGSFTEDIDGSCPSDSTSITINIKGEISEEQKQQAEGDDWPYGQCKEDKQKPEWQNSNFVATTDACYKGSIILATAKKITYSVAHSKLPSYIEEIIQWIEERYRTEYSPYFSLVSGRQLADEGSAELVVQYSAYKPTVDYTIRTPQRHYQYLEVPSGLSDPNNYNPNLDNTHYSRFHLLIETFGISKPCFVNSENVYTPDNATVHNKLTGEYVLAAGDSQDPNRFSAYVKSQGGVKPLVVKIINDGVTLELSRDGATINGKSVSLKEGVQFPEDDPHYAVRVWQLEELVMGYSRRTALFFYYTGLVVDLEQPFTNRGRATGLCGNLNGDPTDDY